VKVFDDLLLRPDPIDTPFVTIPQWLIGRVTPVALELYAHIARRAGPDGWCWFARADFAEKVRPVREDTYRAAINQLEAARAVVVFWRWGTAGDHKGRNAGFAFYRGTTLTEHSLVGPLLVVIPTRVPGVMTPRREDVRSQRIGSDVIRTAADRRPNTQKRVPATPPNDGLGTGPNTQNRVRRSRIQEQETTVEQDPAKNGSSGCGQVAGSGCVA
jgi:hypothetical protein